MHTILITGGTGLVGQQLAKTLVEKGYRVIILTRHKPDGPLPDGISYALWDIKQQFIDVKAVQECQFIVHLAGAGVVEKKWTKSYQEEIVKSRVDSSSLLIHTLQHNSHQVKAVISASAIGFYGADKKPDVYFTEEDPMDNGFLGDTCHRWEESIRPVETLNIRLVKLRIGIVLSDLGGALAEFKKPIRFGVAAILGNGQQMISWIHIDDLCQMILFAIENNQLKGTFNAVAPVPVSNRLLTITLAKRMKGKLFLPVHVPAIFLKLLLGKRSIEVLKSTMVSSQKIAMAGYTFIYPTIEEAVENIIKDK